MKILIATRNKHKVAEIREILSLGNCELLAADEVPGLPEDVEEDSETFEGNALKKARTLRDASGLWTMADDSGLEVAALNGAPGVYSARYAGEPCDNAKNNSRLLKELEGVSDRRARFRCVLALCAPDGREWTLEGVCNGRIAECLSGTEGFGYDPLFIPDGHTESFAAMPPSAKNAISHRARALAAAQREWSSLFNA